MKVIYVGTSRWVSHSPGVAFMTYNANGIALNGVETHLIVVDQSREKTDTLLRQVFDIDRPACLSIHRLEGSSHWRFFRHAMELVDSLLDDHTTVVSRSLSVLPHLLWLRRKRRLKILYESHNYYWDLRQRDDIQKARNLKRCLYERLCIPQVDGLICLQDAQRDLYRRHLSNGFPIVVLQAATHRLFASDVRVRKKVLAYVGSLDKHKGIDNILGLAAHLDHKYTVQILGGKTKPEVEDWRKRVCDAGLEGKVQVTGWLTNAELHRHLATVKWGLLPLQPTFFNVSLTSPLKLFDYYAHGIPVIASDLPSLRTLVEHGRTGFLMDWSKPLHICRAIEIAEQEYAQMSKSALAWTAGRSWQKRGQQLIDFIHSL